MSEIKHGGCLRCGNRDQPILQSRPAASGVMSEALCDACAEKSDRARASVRRATTTPRDN